MIMNNEKYDYYKKLHPDWSDDQIAVAISVDLSADKKISEAGANVSLQDPDLIKSILDGAKEWLREVLPNVFAKVSHFFDKLISTIGEWLSKGLLYVVEAISRLLNRD